MDPRPARERDDFDPLDPETLADPHRRYAELRQRCPVAHSERWNGFWVLTRHAEITEVARDPRRFTSTLQTVVPKVAAKGKRPPLHYDPPEHTAYRRAMNPLFEAHRMRALEPAVRATAVAELTPLLEHGGGDFSARFARRYPVAVLCVFLDIDGSDAEEIKTRSDRYVQALHEDDALTIERESRALYDYARRTVEERRRSARDPESDFTTRLLQTEIDGRPMPVDDVVGAVRALLVAGHLGLTLTLGSCVAHLAADPALQSLLRADPARIGDAIEELLRLYAPNQGFARTATVDVELGGCAIRAGDPLALAYPSGNRDASVFSNPDAFDLDRDNRHSLAFGHGVHKCVGASLARLELRVALEELLARSSRFELSGPLAWTRWPEYGPVCVPIRIEAADASG